MNSRCLTSRKWFYPLIFFLLIALSMWPPYTQIPYDPRNTQQVIIEILQVSILPYASWGWVLHLGTLAVIVLAIWRPRIGGRVMAVYFGFNYLLIAALQTSATTTHYGFAVQTGALIVSGLLGLVWLWVGWKDGLQISFKEVPVWRWFLLPLPLLVFWSPIGMQGSRLIFNFDPLLLLTSPDYGLTYCFMTPVLLFLLILSYPRVDGFAFRVTAFNALLYGLFNLSHWFNPDRIIMGVMHLPLLLLSLLALFMLRFSNRFSNHS
ncbi:MAG: hypothetical protein JW726_13090 [Anaerolineales bacterium]|nr:hypothetical protein [Anaerolineales bacterium]